MAAPIGSAKADEKRVVGDFKEKTGADAHTSGDTTGGQQADAEQQTGGAKKKISKDVAEDEDDMNDEEEEEDVVDDDADDVADADDEEDVPDEDERTEPSETIESTSFSPEQEVVASKDHGATSNVAEQADHTTPAAAGDMMRDAREMLDAFASDVDDFASDTKADAEEAELHAAIGEVEVLPAKKPKASQTTSDAQSSERPLQKLSRQLSALSRELASNKVSQDSGTIHKLLKLVKEIPQGNDVMAPYRKGPGGSTTYVPLTILSPVSILLLPASHKGDKFYVSGENPSVRGNVSICGEFLWGRAGDVG